MIDAGASAHAKPYLIFRILDKRYAIEAPLVREIVRLPEITPIEEAPPFIVGVINLRGQVTPVLDLNLRMNRVSATYTLSDCVVSFAHLDSYLGVIVSEVLEVRNLRVDEIDAPPAFGDTDPRKRPPFLQGVARIDDEMVVTLNPNRLLLSSPAGSAPVPEDPEQWSLDEEPEPLQERRRFLPEATAEERAILRQRAMQLMRNVIDETTRRGSSLAIVRLHDELLAVDLRQVSGFAQRRDITPIPSCPSHIIGDMNLRGEILTVLDLGEILGISASGKPDDESGMETVLVAQHEQTRVGFLVNEALDVAQWDDDALLQSINSGTLQSEHLRGVVSHEGKMVSVLALEKTLSSDALAVSAE
ncbi:chemotaxis protein CheW [Magnetofaba australis]|uniref:Putative CheW protein n=1 Tax=Magnetofaba australis IT-1 TaxID=1434232 RepID=A0A1Y2K605_9PROT|nr:chemotaxis protein CheW [Magnetofaba australis]OSM05142.1 putative CheW protein [Magnetofaba australis IT-1]